MRFIYFFTEVYDLMFFYLFHINAIDEIYEIYEIEKQNFVKKKIIILSFITFFPQKLNVYF